MRVKDPGSVSRRSPRESEIRAASRDQEAVSPEAAKTSAYANFHDVFGLLFRMLRSGNRAAYAALLRESLAKLATPLDLALSPWERRRIAAARPTGLPLILIVGPPRAGTTLVSQVLARYLDVSYFTNLSALFPRAPITATRSFSWFLAAPKPPFRSYYGNTSRLAGANEGFHIWNRWLGADRYRTAESLAPDAQRDMVRFFDAWLCAFEKPLLNKSVRNTAAVTLLASAIENAYFICVRRDARMVVQSLILARQHIQGSKAIGWGLYGRDSRTASDPLAYVDDVCGQVLDIKAQVQRAKAEVGSARLLEVDYDSFCAAPRRTIQDIVSIVPNVSLRRERLDELQPFCPSHASRLTAEEVRRMEQALAREAKVEAGRPHIV